MKIIQTLLTLLKKYRTESIILGLVLLAGLFYGLIFGITPEKFTVSRLNRELVFFSMNGCGHCEEMKPTWDLLVNNYGDNNFVELKHIVAQDKPELTEQYKVTAFPTILALKDGKLNLKYDGDRSYEDLVRFLNYAMTN